LESNKSLSVLMLQHANALLMKDNHRQGKNG
jgi:hypothetical protein